MTRVNCQISVPATIVEERPECPLDLVATIVKSGRASAISPDWVNSYISNTKISESR